MMKLSNKKRKYRKFWHGCLLLGILLTALAVPVWGRAGGGSSGGGGGHSGSSGEAVTTAAAPHPAAI
ncbi:hypothetical protein LC724_07075 [Blautia sp. RD014234]|nr:hypothetical protein [Blautia parvula]